MKRMAVLLTVFCALVICPATLADFAWNDGLTHFIDDPLIYQTLITLDDGVDNDPGTHAEMVDNGIAKIVNLYNNASFTASGGIAQMLFSYDNSNILIEGGEVFYTFAQGNSQVNVTGGQCGGFSAYENSVVYLHGHDFVLEADGKITSLSYGDRISDFTDDQGLLSGTLSDGTRLGGFITRDGIFHDAMPFEIYREQQGHTADIIIVPEPCSLALIALGGLILRKRAI